MESRKLKKNEIRHEGKVANPDANNTVAWKVQRQTSCSNLNMYNMDRKGSIMTVINKKTLL